MIELGPHLFRTLLKMTFFLSNSYDEQYALQFNACDILFVCVCQAMFPVAPTGKLYGGGGVQPVLSQSDSNIFHESILDLYMYYYINHSDSTLIEDTG